MTASKTFVSFVVVSFLTACSPASSPVATSMASSPPSSTDPVALSGRIVFDRLDGTFGYEVPRLGTIVLDMADAEAAEQELEIDYGGESLAPTWSPDGTQLLINVFDPPDFLGRPVIIGLEDAEATVVEPEDFEAFLTCSDWSPDGARLACSLDDDANPETEGIYMVATDGSDMARVTTSPNPSVEGTDGACGGNDIAPAFSPDGNRIAFLRARCGSGANPSSDQAASLWVVNTDGTEATELVEEGIPNSHGFSRVRWSPDGTRLVFAGETGMLLVADMETGGFTTVELVGTAGSDSFAYTPDWAPDGEMIIFSLFTGGGTDLFVVPAAGGAVIQITDAPGAEVWASWTTDQIP